MDLSRENMVVADHIAEQIDLGTQRHTADVCRAQLVTSIRPFFEMQRMEPPSQMTLNEQMQERNLVWMVNQGRAHVQAVHTTAKYSDVLHAWLFRSITEKWRIAVHVHTECVELYRVAFTNQHRRTNQRRVDMNQPPLARVNGNTVTMHANQFALDFVRRVLCDMTARQYSDHKVIAQFQSMLLWMYNNRGSISDFDIPTEHQNEEPVTVKTSARTRLPTEHYVANTARWIKMLLASPFAAQLRGDSLSKLRAVWDSDELKWTAMRKIKIGCTQFWLPFTEIINKVELAAVIRERTMSRHGAQVSAYNQRQEEATQHQVEQGLRQEQLGDELARSEYELEQLRAEVEEWKLRHAALQQENLSLQRNESAELRQMRRELSRALDREKAWQAERTQLQAQIRSLTAQQSPLSHFGRLSSRPDVSNRNLSTVYCPSSAHTVLETQHSNPVSGSPFLQQMFSQPAQRVSQLSFAL